MNKVTRIAMKIDAWAFRRGGWRLLLYAAALWGAVGGVMEAVR